MRTPEASSTNNAIARAIALGQEREAIELRYHRARIEYIDAFQALGRFGSLYGRLVATIPDSIDLERYSTTHREPMVPRLVTAGEVGSGDGPRS
jgi:hypothetical protein